MLLRNTREMTYDRKQENFTANRKHFRLTIKTSEVFNRFYAMVDPKVFFVYPLEAKSRGD